MNKIEWFWKLKYVQSIRAPCFQIITRWFGVYTATIGESLRDWPLNGVLLTWHPVGSRWYFRRKIYKLVPLHQHWNMQAGWIRNYKLWTGFVFLFPRLWRAVRRARIRSELRVMEGWRTFELYWKHETPCSRYPHLSTAITFPCSSL